jgi:hypothetical protein
MVSHWVLLITSYSLLIKNGGLAQLARAPALHAGGHRFDSDILHLLKRCTTEVEQMHQIIYWRCS